MSSAIYLFVLVSFFLFHFVIFYGSKLTHQGTSGVLLFGELVLVSASVHENLKILILK